MGNEDDVPCCAYCYSCGSSCITTAIALFINLIILVCLASLTVWTMLRSNTVKFQIQDAELTRFDLQNSSNNVYYNLSLTFSIRNSNSHIGIHYDSFEAIVYYSDQRLASVSVPSFYQGHKNTTVLEAVFQGQNLVLLGEHGREKYEDERRLGVYGIDVKVRIQSRVLFAHLVTWEMRPIIRCHLKVPLGSSSLSGGFDFRSTKCGLHI